MKSETKGLVSGTLEVLFPIPGGGPYSYIPPRGIEYVEPGSRVVAPLGKRILTGVVVKSLPPGQGYGGKMRRLIEVVDTFALLDKSLIDMTGWLAEYYFCDPGEALRSAVPGVFFSTGGRKVKICTDNFILLETLAGPKREIVEYLRAKGAVAYSALRKKVSSPYFSKCLRELENGGMVELVETPPNLTSSAERTLVEKLPESEIPQVALATLGRAHRQRECYEYLSAIGHAVERTFLVSEMNFSRSVIDGLVSKGLAVERTEAVDRDPFSGINLPDYKTPTPNAAQRRAIDSIIAAIGSHEVFLLHGVTGSGKTLVYIEALRPVIESGGQAIVLVPEIALTPQTTGRFRAVFGDRVAVLHSGLSDGERFDIWRGIRLGKFDLVVGARSAVFAPFPDLRMIIIDEEHENTYKQGDSTPRYHAREVAVRRMKECRGPVVLGSATPSLESWQHARDETYGMLSLPERASGQPMPPVEIHDLRKGWKKGSGHFITERILSEIRAAREAGGQTILLLNRRGFNSSIICADCGGVVQCPHCMISLTYHRARKRMRCHYCGFHTSLPESCPVCRSSALDRLGSGTERLESLLRESLPEFTIDRMDLDTTGGKWSHHEILEKLRTGKTDILIGTQMIAKGLDFPGVLLVGVLNADVGMNLPDFRATERTFQLVSQVAGRTGRGERGGQVVIQTFNPKHPAIMAAVDHDYQEFSTAELIVREEAEYPPFVVLANIVISGKLESEVSSFAETVKVAADRIRQEEKLSESLELVGPSPCPVEKIRDRWRWHLIVKAHSAHPLETLCRVLREKVTIPARGSLRLIIDRDPLSLM